MKNALLAAVAATAMGMALAQGTGDETVSIYLQAGAKDRDRFALSSRTVVVYPERRCSFTELAEHQRMRAATISRVPHCAFTQGDTVYVVHPTAGLSSYPAVFFATAKVDQTGMATVTQPGFDSEKAQQQFLRAERDLVKRSALGALPPRGSAQP